MHPKSIFLIAISLLLTNTVALTQTNAGNQLTKSQQWQLLDYKQDSVYGMSVNKAYNELLKGKQSHPVIVAVIDEGVDITHEDLQGHIWTNTKEIPGNQIDDDHNGYTDDIHGWNFLGGKDGGMMYATSTEADREYYRLAPKYNSVTDSSKVADKKEYTYFLRAKNEHINDSVERTESHYLKSYKHFVNKLQQFQALTGKKKVYYDDINFFQPKDSTSDTLKKYLLKFFIINPDKKTWDLDSMVNIPETLETMHEIERQQALFAALKPDPNALRKEIVGDDPFNINDRNYGNNNIEDSAYGGHGTSCASIIAAIRKNGIGMNGISGNVLIMPVRAVNTLHPGDEMDKDIALAIRYAVDNGAKIVNMSFGKDFSPNKQWVDDAIKYAAQKNVLLVHASGNAGLNIDSMPVYPYPEFLNSGKAENLITVGASTEDINDSLPGFFSNYGQKETDVFAPGMDIYEAEPNNKYDEGSGTSMAAPMVAGVAALILEYYPQLTAVQVKDIIIQSVTPLKGKMVYKPGTQEQVDFASLCISGGVANAYNALQIADKIASKK
ncbi:MAG TPA: S8 family peptidase [Parafilimonas sp.]|nr:S8 family peptidase [Parafilimonas sp.]